MPPSLALPVRHLPSWMPGAAFLRQAVIWKKETDTMFDEPFDLFTSQMVSSKGCRARLVFTKHLAIPYLPFQRDRPPATTQLKA